MKNIINSKPQLVTRVIYLIPLLLIYTIGLCIAHVVSSESDVTLANINANKLIDHPVHATPVPASSAKTYGAEEIESFHDVLRRVARADAARSLNATRQSVLNELQENVSSSLYAFKPDNSDMQQVADNDGEKSLAAIRQVVTVTLKDNVSDLFHDQFQYLGKPGLDEKQIASDGKVELAAPYQEAYKIADKSQ